MSAYAVENLPRRWFTGEEHTNMKLTIPSNAEKILHILEENGLLGKSILINKKIKKTGSRDI